jgi:hypothetical protein
LQVHLYCLGRPRCNGHHSLSPLRRIPIPCRHFHCRQCKVRSNPHPRREHHGRAFCCSRHTLVSFLALLSYGLVWPVAAALCSVRVGRIFHAINEFGGMVAAAIPARVVGGARIRMRRVRVSNDDFIAKSPKWPLKSPKKSRTPLEPAKKGWSQTPPPPPPGAEIGSVQGL